LRGRDRDLVRPWKTGQSFCVAGHSLDSQEKLCPNLRTCRPALTLRRTKNLASS